MVKQSNLFIAKMLKNNTFTENGMPANSTSLSSLVDMLFKMGAIRTGRVTDKTRANMVTTFYHAFKENKEKAIKLLFHARDIESGLGEREFFRVNIMWLIKNGYISIVEKNLLNVQSIKQNIIRVDDIIYIINELIVNNVKLDGVEVFIENSIKLMFSLLKDASVSGIVAKWMPRKSSKYNAVVLYMRKHGYISTYSNYRKYIVDKTKVVEQLMSSNHWKDINLSKVPSIAMKKYKKAFNRHLILKPFVEKLIAGEATVHAKRLYPNDIIIEVLSNRHIQDNNIRALLNEQWKALNDLDEISSEFKMLPIIDVSGSMLNPMYIPMSIALGIGFFIAERNPNEAFRDYFITFSSNPAFQKIIGADIFSKVENALKANWAMNTDLEKTFELILNRALQYNVPKSDMPTHLIIISDMQFDSAVSFTGDSAIEMIRRKYVTAGYDMPTIVFWNANDIGRTLPAQITDNGVLLVSGKSQNTVNFILKKQYENMECTVDEIINMERYSYITI